VLMYLIGNSTRATQASMSMATFSSMTVPLIDNSHQGDASVPTPHPHSPRPYAVVSITAKPSISTSVSFWKKREISNRAIAG
jgi:hypothetical protein